MTTVKELNIVGYTAEDIRRIKSHLEKLLPFLDIEQLYIVGGLAIRFLLSQRGIKYQIREFNDLDLKIKKASAVSPRVQNKFLVYHYHPPKNNSFYIVLIDPESGTKVDIFDWNIPVEKYTTVKFGKYLLKMRSAEDQFVKTVFDIQRISEEKKVDPKQFLDAKLLAKISNIDLADRIWKKRNFKEYPKSINDALKKANKIAKDHPEWVKKDPFKRPKPYKCPACQNTSGFKVTSMSKIYKVLGYVE